MRVRIDEGHGRRPLGARRFRSFTAFFALIASAAALIAPSPSGAEELIPSYANLATGPAVGPTAAWARFCADQPAECRVDLSQAATVAYTSGLWDQIVAVNGWVNRSIRPVTDIEHWNVSDRWDYPTDGEGDCEDIQLLKRRKLAELGIPARAMRMAMVINPEGEGHAVLVVSTSRGDFVLDNRIDEVRPWYRTGYVWVKREGDSAEQWVSLGGVKQPVETAARQ